MKPNQKKIVIGVCGIGLGHTFRQLPLIEHFSKTAQVVIFGYGKSFEFYSNYFNNVPNIYVLSVAVPFLIGNNEGIDFTASMQCEANLGIDFFHMNSQAFAAAMAHIGKPDLVISDYEPMSASYAYLHDAPLVTIDQQSKYLTGSFPESIFGFSHQDENTRLRLFFPKADARIACSFFKVALKESPDDRVLIYPPIIKNGLIDKQRTVEGERKSILVYLSSQKKTDRSDFDFSILNSFPEVDFHVFLPSHFATPNPTLNAWFYQHGNPEFDRLFPECSGIITTAGHMLISEAMYLGIPVFAIPLPLYEQHMSAKVIHENKFGITDEQLTQENLRYFIENIYLCAQNIQNDTEILLRTPGQFPIIEFLEKRYLS